MYAGALSASWPPSVTRGRMKTVSMPANGAGAGAVGSGRPRDRVRSQARRRPRPTTGRGGSPKPAGAAPQSEGPCRWSRRSYAPGLGAAVLGLGPCAPPPIPARGLWVGTADRGRGGPLTVPGPDELSPFKLCPPTAPGADEHGEDRGEGSCDLGRMSRAAGPASTIVAGSPPPGSPWRSCLTTWHQPPEEASGDLCGALLLAHSGVHDQHRAGQGGDRPLQRREPPLGVADLRRGVGRWIGAALHWDVTRLFEPPAEQPRVGGCAEGGDGQGGLDRACGRDALLAREPTPVRRCQPRAASQVRGNAGQVQRGPARPAGAGDP